MSQACLPDPARSRAVLIGASHFTTAGPDLPDIPAVQANLTALRQGTDQHRHWGTETRAPGPRWTAFPLDLLREEIANSAG